MILSQLVFGQDLERSNPQPPASAGNEARPHEYSREAQLRRMEREENFRSWLFLISALTCAFTAGTSVWFIVQWRRRAAAAAAEAEALLQSASIEKDEPALFQCATCGATEKSHPMLDFRVAADGQDYCSIHLPTRT